MFNDELAQIQPVIEQYLKDKGLELIELAHRFKAGQAQLSLLIDRPEGGITLGECSQANREIGAIIEGKNIFPQGFSLEVSSPGIDRPLSSKNDFIRCRGKRVAFFLKYEIEGKLEWHGSVKDTGDDAVMIDAQGKLISIPFLSISKARQEI